MLASQTYALLLLCAFLVVGFLVVRLPLVSKVYLPASLIGGLLLLILGPQVAGHHFAEWQLNAKFYDFWSLLPKQLINVVFACLFLARSIPPARRMWRMAGPQVAFGQMLAWGQYALGGLLTLLILKPILGSRDITAALIEMSFEGGHGTVSGMAPVFEQLKFLEGKDLALGLATVSLCTALLSGVILVHWGRRRGHIKNVYKTNLHERIYHRRIVYELNKNGIKLRDHLTPKKVAAHVVLILLSVLVGWLIYNGLLTLEDNTWGKQGLIIFEYMPMFTFCMLGGVIAQRLWSRLGLQTSRPLIELLGGIALSLLIASAVATMSLTYISSHLPIFILLAVTGIAWIVIGFVVLARHMFKKHWFQNGIVNAAQSMGMTATGLLFLHMVDPHNKTTAMESFGYKQLMFEPFMGGGIVTALAMPAIIVLGLPTFTLITGAICLTWMLLGCLYFGRKYS